jgi:hypothetical protein
MSSAAVRPQVSTGDGGRDSYPDPGPDPAAQAVGSRRRLRAEQVGESSGGPCRRTPRCPPRRRTARRAADARRAPPGPGGHAGRLAGVGRPVPRLRLQGPGRRPPLGPPGRGRRGRLVRQAHRRRDVDGLRQVPRLLAARPHLGARRPCRRGLRPGAHRVGARPRVRALPQPHQGPRRRPARVGHPPALRVARPRRAGRHLRRRHPLLGAQVDPGPRGRGPHQPRLPALLDAAEPRPVGTVPALAAVRGRRRGARVPGRVRRARLPRAATPAAARRLLRPELGDARQRAHPYPRAAPQRQRAAAAARGTDLRGRLRHHRRPCRERRPPRGRRPVRGRRRHRGHLTGRPQDLRAVGAARAAALRRSLLRALAGRPRRR